MRDSLSLEWQLASLNIRRLRCVVVGDCLSGRSVCVVVVVINNGIHGEGASTRPHPSEATGVCLVEAWFSNHTAFDHLAPCTFVPGATTVQ